MTELPKPSPKWLARQERKRAAYEAARANWKRQNPDRPKEDSKK